MHDNDIQGLSLIYPQITLSFLIYHIHYMKTRTFEEDVLFFCYQVLSLTLSEVQLVIQSEK